VSYHPLEPTATKDLVFFRPQCHLCKAIPLKNNELDQAEITLRKPAKAIAHWPHAEWSPLEFGQDDGFEIYASAGFSQSR
jgi:hypothetical protein